MACFLSSQSSVRRSVLFAVQAWCQQSGWTRTSKPRTRQSTDTSTTASKGQSVDIVRPGNSLPPSSAITHSARDDTRADTLQDQAVAVSERRIRDQRTPHAVTPGHHDIQSAIDATAYGEYDPSDQRHLESDLLNDLNSTQKKPTTTHELLTQSSNTHCHFIMGDVMYNQNNPETVAPTTTDASDTRVKSDSCYETEAEKSVNRNKNEQETSCTDSSNESPADVPCTKNVISGHHSTHAGSDERKIGLPPSQIPIPCTTDYDLNRTSPLTCESSGSNGTKDSGTCQSRRLEQKEMKAKAGHVPDSPENLESVYTDEKTARPEFELESEANERRESTSLTEDGHPGGDVVLVTGGNGFLGQHIVKMLQVKAPHVAQIRVLDLVPFTQRLEYQATKPVKDFTGSITDAHFLMSAFEGVTCCMHVAGLVSWGTFPDEEGMKKVNVQGTLNVVNACLQADVSRLIYCSTVDVVVGFEPIRGGQEDNTPIPDNFLFPSYPDTKYQGERIVLGASDYAKEDGTHLQTLALRVNVMYGELDPYYVLNGLREAKERKGVLQQIGDGSAMFQQCYVGNSAWAFVCADLAMKDNPRLTSLPFFVPDDTPVQNTFNFMRPYLEARGFHLSQGRLSYRLVYTGLRISEAIVGLLSPITRINIRAQSCTVAYINMDIFFNGRKGRQILNYKPIFTANQARLSSLPYYEKVPL